MDVSTHLNAVQLLRSWDLPNNMQDVCGIILQRDLALLSSFFEKYPDSKIRMLIIPDLEAGKTEFIRLPVKDTFITIPIGRLNEQGLKLSANLSKTIFFSPDPYGSLFVTTVCRYLSIYGIKSVSLYAGQKNAFGIRQPLPEFYEQNKDNIQKIYHFLADEESKDIFIRRIKAIMTGNAGYLPVSIHEEYYHPLVHPEQGDFMIDGGISDMVGVQEQFAQSVGDKGHIFGFEPIPSMAETAKQKLARFPQYHLQTAGLGEKNSQVWFDYLRDSSRMSTMQGSQDAILCDTISIDEFTKKHHIKKINCIKLDIEGAEMLALAGSKETILKNRPKLIVCLYHKPSDLLEIPLFIHELVPEYKIYIAHSTSHFTDTILYAHI